MKYGLTIPELGVKKIVFTYENFQEDPDTQKRILGHIFSEIGIKKLKPPGPGEYKKVIVSRFGENKEMVAFEIDSEVLIVKLEKSAKRRLQKWLSKISKIRE